MKRHNEYQQKKRVLDDSVEKLLPTVEETRRDIEQEVDNIMEQVEKEHNLRKFIEDRRGRELQ